MAPIGMENGRIPLASLRTKFPSQNGIPDSRNFSRLNGVIPEFPHGWMPHSTLPDYLQIDLGGKNIPKNLIKLIKVVHVCLLENPLL